MRISFPTASRRRRRRKRGSGNGKRICDLFVVVHIQVVGCEMEINEFDFIVVGGLLLMHCRDRKDMGIENEPIMSSYKQTHP